MTTEDRNYPLNDTHYRHESSITENFHEDKFTETSQDDLTFEVSGPDFIFRPMYYPNRVTVGKQRDIVREKGICRNEYVRDVGTENREIHVVGFVTPAIDQDLATNRQPRNDAGATTPGNFNQSNNNSNYRNNLQSYHNLCDFGQRAMLITMQWAGEVVLEDSELEGPEGVDPSTGHYLYEYTLDFVSTGRHEMGTASTGILNEGSSDETVMERHD